MNRPQLRRVQAALRTTTETFATQLGEPGRSAPEWSEFEWIMAKAAAVLHGVTPLTAGSLRWRGPGEWERFVRQQFQQTDLRHRRMTALLNCIDEMARADALAFVALKGSALHAMQLYTSGQRPMADIDLLVHESDASSMTRLLQPLGFRQTSAIWKHRTFESQAPDTPCEAAFGEHELAPIKIELHTRIAERLPIHEADISQYIFPRQFRPGLNPYPSNAALMLHLLLHAAGNIMARSLRLIQLHDIALLASRMTDGEWDQLLHWRVAGRPAWWAVPPLRLAQRYYRHCIPSEVVRQLSLRCPRGLNRASLQHTVSDVSFTALADKAFPALAWARSYSERLAYMRARCYPRPEERALLAMTFTEGWAMRSGWSKMSRTQRAIRGLVMQAPRLCSMYIVHAAMQASQQPSREA